MDKETILTAGMEALYVVAQATNSSFTISHRFTTYGAKVEHCRISIFGKSFVERGPKCIQRAIKAAVVFAVRNFTPFADMRQEMEETLKTEKPCKPGTFEIKSYAR